jgi:hypothetical protein
MLANPLQGPLEGVGPEILNFFGSKWHLLRLLPFQSLKKSRFSGPTPSNCTCNGCCPHQNHHIKTTGTSIVNLAATEGMQELQSNKFKANELLF